MYSLLLAIIYLAFISLGLPDSLLGSAWPIMHKELGIDLSYAGIITMIISGGTIISSLFSAKLNKKLGTAVVTSVSVLLTAIAMLGFSFSQEFWQLCLLAIPYGLGAGAIDAALNNYVAIHYSSKHMSWLHCFWGIGTIISPYIMSYSLSGGFGWSGGYRIVSIIQIILSIILFLSIPMWTKTKNSPTSGEDKKIRSLSMIQTLKITGVPFVLIALFCYCTIEQTTMLWASSYLVNYKKIDAQIAASFASLFCLGITFGRLISGFITEKLGDKKMINLGMIVIILGIILLFLPIKTYTISLVGFITIGLGCAPIYPAILHSTPQNFGKENSQSIIGVQMASAYVGTTFMPPLFGLIAQHLSIKLLPMFLTIFVVLIILMIRIMNKKIEYKI